MFLSLLLSTTMGAQVCPAPDLDRPPPAEATVIRIVLEPRDLPRTESLPLIGDGPERNFHVRGQVVAVERGTFSVKPGGSIRLAVHSLVMSFGSDHVGEEYLIALDRRGQIRWLAPDAERLVRVRGSVVSLSRRATPGVIRLVQKPELFARLKIIAVSNGAGMFRAGEELAVGIAGEIAAGQSYCFILIARASSAVRPFRLVRIQR